MESLKKALADQIRFLTFQFRSEDYDNLGREHFYVGLFFTWMVGIARNWDFPAAPWFASAGLPSVAYIFFMAAMMAASLFLISGKKHGYFRFLTVVSLTAAPGLIYGIPVEQLMSASEAQRANLNFLSIVALWRVALFAHFAVKGCRMKFLPALLGMFTPISAIIVAIVLSGRAKFVIDLMGGMQRERRNSADFAANELISILYCLSLPILVAGTLLQIIYWLSFTSKLHEDRSL